jgi:hypothetical protein
MRPPPDLPKNAFTLDKIAESAECVVKGGDDLHPHWMEPVPRLAERVERGPVEAVGNWVRISLALVFSGATRNHPEVPWHPQSVAMPDPSS